MRRQLLLPARCLLAAAALLAATSVASAGAAQKPLHLRYSVHWGGLHAADAALMLEEEAPETYRSEIRIESRGLVQLLTNFRSRSFSRWRELDGGAVEPLEYRSTHSTRGRQRSTSIDFDEATGRAAVTTEELEDGEDPERASRDLQVAAVDPLMGVMMLRSRVAEALVGGPRDFAVELFDGRKRLNLEAHVVGRTQREWRGERRDMIHVVMKILDMEGFHRKDIDLARGAEEIDVYLSDDDRLVPLLLYAAMPIATGVVTLEEECEAACTL